MCAFNYRFVPAVRLAREMIESGELGEITHFRGSYLQEWGATDDALWRFDKDAAGSGALGDLGAHVIDLARYLVGEIETVSALTATFQPGREVDDAIEAVVAFESGAVGTIEASRFATGRKNAFTWEINGSNGSIAFDLERLNELQVHFTDSSPGASAQGFRTVLVSEADHPFWEHWWPHGHIIGWEHTFVHELHHLLTAIRDDSDVAPHGATLEDGYRAAEVCDAMLRSAEGGGREPVALPLTPTGLSCWSARSTPRPRSSTSCAIASASRVWGRCSWTWARWSRPAAAPDVTREEVGAETGVDVAGAAPPPETGERR